MIKGFKLCIHDFENVSSPAIVFTHSLNHTTNIMIIKKNSFLLKLLNKNSFAETKDRAKTL